MVIQPIGSTTIISKTSQGSRVIQPLVSTSQPILQGRETPSSTSTPTPLSGLVKLSSSVIKKVQSYFQPGARINIPSVDFSGIKPEIVRPKTDLLGPTPSVAGASAQLTPQAKRLATGRIQSYIEKVKPGLKEAVMSPIDPTIGFFGEYIAAFKRAEGDQTVKFEPQTTNQAIGVVAHNFLRDLTAMEAGGINTAFINGMKTLDAVIGASPTLTAINNIPDAVTKKIMKAISPKLGYLENYYAKNKLTFDVVREVQAGRGTPEQISAVKKANARGSLPEIVRASRKMGVKENSKISEFVRQLVGGVKKVFSGVGKDRSGVKLFSEIKPGEKVDPRILETGKAPAAPPTEVGGRLAIPMDKSKYTGLKTASVVVRPDGTGSMFVEFNKEAQGQGQGTAFVKEAEQKLLEKGVNKVQIQSFKESLGFWEKLGYRETGVSTGRGDLVNMEKSLTVLPPSVKPVIQSQEAPVKPIGEGIPKELESLAQEARKYKSAEEFVKGISKDTYAPEYRNPLADYYRKSVYEPLSHEAYQKGVGFSTNPIQLEGNLDMVLEKTISKNKLENMSVKQKAEMVLGKNWTKRYLDSLNKGGVIGFVKDFYTQATKGVEAKPQGIEMPPTAKTAVVEAPSGIKAVEKELAGEVEKRIGEIVPPIGLGIKRVFKPAISDKVIGLKKQVKFNDPEIESRYKNAKGINTRGYYMKRVKDFVQNFYHRATRTYPDLPNKPEFAEVKIILGRTQNVRSVVQDKTARILQGITADIGPNKLDVFTRKVILDDLVQEAKEKRALPLGYSEYDDAGNLTIKEELLNVDKEKIDKLVFANPDIAEALARRDKMWKAITDELVEYDILKEEQVKKDYFRHQILEYVNAKSRVTKGVGPALKQRKPGYAKQRQGSTYDINTDYLQAEFEVMSQALHDIEIAKLLKRVERLPINIKSDLVKKAKEGEDWHDLIPEGYVTWQPKDGRVFYQVNTIPERIVNQFIDDIGAGVLKIDQGLINKALAVGGKRKELVLPEEVAKTLDNLWIAKQPNWVTDSTKALTTLWKKWVLFNPRRAIKYNYQNFLGDADAVFAANPAVFKKMPQATKELYAVFKEGAPMTDTMKDFFERGGFSSMLTIQEIPDIKNIRIFERLYEKAGRAKTLSQKLNIVKGYWDGVIKFTQFRESQLRYAAYLDYVERFTSGKNLNYGASNRLEVDALGDIKDKAAKVATELLGDYANITALGKDLRESAIPFYSWMEINMRRYPAILRNAWQEGAGKGMGTSAKVLGLGTIKGAWATLGTLLRIIALTGGVMTYNQLFHSDAEQDLLDYDRGRMHINLGYDKNGEVSILRGQGALSDFLEWFGLDEAPILWREYFEGKASLTDIFGKIPLVTGKIGIKPIVSKFMGSITPTYKIPFEIISGRSWPFQGTESYPIEDKWRKLFQNIQLENEYDFIFQKPSRGYLKSWGMAVITKTNPQENAYRHIQSQKYAYLETKGKGGSSNYYSPRSIVYRAYKKALIYGDKRAEEKAWDEMKKLGVKPADLKKSLEWTDPLSGLSKEEKKEFVNEYLSQSDRERLKKANEYYKKVFLNR